MGIAGRTSSTHLPWEPVGYDFKRTKNNLEFGGTQIFDTSFDLSQFVITYSGAFPERFERTNFELSLFGSPGDMTSGNDGGSFAQSRTGGRLSLHLRPRAVQPRRAAAERLHAFTFHLASGPLVATEQIGFGGFNSVRGYDERIINGDSGLIMNHELRTPAFSPLKLAGVRRIQDSLQLLAFFDYGFAKIQEPRNGETAANRSPASASAPATRSRRIFRFAQIRAGNSSTCPPTKPTAASTSA